jgi:hypothetical protein
MEVLYFCDAVSLWISRATRHRRDHRIRNGRSRKVKAANLNSPAAILKGPADDWFGTTSV